MLPGKGGADLTTLESRLMHASYAARFFFGSAGLGSFPCFQSPLTRMPRLFRGAMPHAFRQSVRIAVPICTGKDSAKPVRSLFLHDVRACDRLDSRLVRQHGTFFALPYQSDEGRGDRSPGTDLCARIWPPVLRCKMKLRTSGSRVWAISYF